MVFEIVEPTIFDLIRPEDNILIRERFVSTFFFANIGFLFF